MTTQPQITSWSLTAAGKWTQAEAIELCRAIEAVCPAFGCHVALTGGALYKDGPRKDADVLFYRIRQVKRIDKKGLFEALQRVGLFEALQRVGLFEVKGFGWCHKATWRGKPVDVFFPEEQGNEYEGANSPALVG